MTVPIEIEVRFSVPAKVRGALATDLARGSSSLSRESLTADYLDTPDRRLARAGLAWRLRREGRRWVQTLKAGGLGDSGPLERFEHEVIRPDATHDAKAHAGTAVGDRLVAILERARQDGIEPEVRFRSEIRRTTRRMRTRGAVVELSFDEGRLVADGHTQRVRELEFELVSGSATSMLALAERWRRKFGLVLEPRSKAERGDRLAEGADRPALRKAMKPKYPATVGAAEAFGAVASECLDHIIRNAAGLSAGDAALRVGQVHQLRVGIRRLRSALRVFDGWVAPPPESLVDGLRDLFATLGRARDSDVLSTGVASELVAAGAPALTLPLDGAVVDPAEVAASDATQRLLLSWIAWRTGPAEAPPAAPAAPASDDAPALVTDGGPEAPDSATEADHVARFHRDAAKRLRRWHERFRVDWNSFATLDDEALHSLRKRIKRQRYAVEFLAPVLRRRGVERYLKPLVALQERMGELNDLLVARTRYQALVDSDPAGWFAVGWLAARIASERAAVEPRLRDMVKAEPPPT